MMMVKTILIYFGYGIQVFVKFYIKSRFLMIKTMLIESPLINY